MPVKAAQKTAPKRHVHTLDVELFARISKKDHDRFHSWVKNEMHHTKPLPADIKRILLSVSKLTPLEKELIRSMK